MMLTMMMMMKMMMMTTHPDKTIEGNENIFHHKEGIAFTPTAKA